MAPNDSTDSPDTLQTGETCWVGANPAELANWKPTCPNGGTITGYSLALNRRIYVATRCSRWSCEYCGPRKVWRLAFRVAHAKPNRLITLTCRPANYPAPRDAFDDLRRKVAILGREIRRSVGEFEYLRVLENTQAGWPHFHLVARSPYVHHTVLSKAWARLANAPIVDIRKINDPKHTLSYIVKYLSKQTHIDYTHRRLSWTKRFFLDPPTEKAPGLDIQEVDRSKLHWTVYMTTYLSGCVIEHLFAGVFAIAAHPERPYT